MSEILETIIVVQICFWLGFALGKLHSFINQPRMPWE